MSEDSDQLLSELLRPKTLRVRPETSGWIAEFSEHETD
jgi:hypothetical protein